MKILVLFIIIMSSAINAQAQAKTLLLTENKVCQIIFPQEIKKFRGGFDPNTFVLDQYENILYIQCLTSFSESNLSVITNDNSYYIFNLLYRDKVEQSAYVVSEADRIHQHNITTEEKSTTNTTTTQTQDNDKITLDIQKVLDAKNFIISNNGLKAKSMEIFLKGIYANGQNLYFKLELTNNSEIPYSYNYIGFAAISKKKGRTTSADRIDIQPTATYVPTTTIVKGNKLTVVYKFDKFTVGKDRKLFIEIIENNGERNFSFPITDEIILDAQAIN